MDSRAGFALLFSCALASLASAAPLVQRVTTVVPYPRGLAMVNGDLYVLARGRVRGAGGVSAAVNDRAGTIYRVDPSVGEALDSEPAASRTNGEIVAEPTSPPFHLWDRSSVPAESDRFTDRPYCTLRYHEPSNSLYICAFSGVDLARTKEYPSAFSKNLTDGLLRFDLGTKTWSDIERHDPRAGGNYPQHDPDFAPPPHGWLNGPDNILPLGKWLYAVAKDNSSLVRYDLSALPDEAGAPPPPGEFVLGDTIDVQDWGTQYLMGDSALAYDNGWLYIAFRTTSEIARFRMDEDFNLVQPIRGEFVAWFDPYDPATGESANLTDMGFDDRGRLYAISAKPARIYRFTPDPKNLFDARAESAPAWADLATITANPKMKSENVLYHDGWLYVTSGDGYSYQLGAEGTVYRVKVDD